MTDEWDGKGESLQTSRLVADDLVTANVKDNGDGTITLQMQPKYVNMSAPGKDAQGHMFQSLGAIDSTVDSIKPLTWSEGTTADNCKVNYYGGTATVTINTKQTDFLGQGRRHPIGVTALVDLKIGGIQQLGRVLEPQVTNQLFH